MSKEKQNLDIVCFLIYMLCIGLYFFSEDVILHTISFLLIIKATVFIVVANINNKK